MKDKIYLVISRGGVQSMRKSLVDVKRGEVCVLLNIDIADSAFKPPVLEQFVVIDNWHSGIDIEDVKFNQSIITGEEAEIIKTRRIEKMKQILESQGYEVAQKEKEVET